MVLASLSGTGLTIVLAAYFVLLALVFFARPRDVTGRRRALGCIAALAIFFGLFVVAAAYWAADAIF